MTEDPARRPGRRKKPPEERQSAQLFLYVTESEFDAVARLALRSGSSLSGFLRTKLFEALGISHYEKQGAA